MAVVDEILEKIGSLTLLEAADLVKKMEEKFGVSAAAPVAVAAVAAGPAAPAEEEAPTDVSVILEDCGANKINVLKEVRAITGLGLKEAKDLVDNAPKPIKEGIKKEEAADIKAKLEAAGAKVTIK
jgi:large subunit ribosomal protein L7/L12